jgi:hypothetical protein
VPAAVVAICAAAAALVLLAALHVLSPEFSPAWPDDKRIRQRSHASVLSAMFAVYGLCSLALAFGIRSQLPTRTGRIGLAALVMSGVRQCAAASSTSTRSFFTT